MAYSLNGNNAYMDFSIGNLTGVDGGPLSIAALVNLGDAANGAIAHIINSAGAAGVVFLETFGTLNYGVNTIARTISSANLSTLGVIGNWAVIGGSKADVSANPVGHYGVLGSSLTHFTATSSLTDVSAGSAADSTFKVRLGRFLNSGSEYINAAYAVVFIWKRVLTNPEWDSLSTGNYATWTGLGPDWGVEFTAIGTRNDVTGGGGNELSRTGTSPAITLVADPPGFFGSSGILDGDTFTLDDSTFRIATSHLDTLTFDDSAFKVAASSSDSLTMDDSSFRITVRDVDSMTISDAAFAVAVRESDSFVMTESGLSLVVKDSEQFTVTEGTPKVATTSTDTFTLSDVTASVAVRESDSFTMSDTTVKLGVTDSDTALLSETQRGNVTVSESFTLDDTAVRLSLTVTDTFTLASELERLGIHSSDAFTVSDAAFSGKGSVTSGDTFALIEQETVGGLPESPVPSVPITITLTSPSLTMKLGTPHVVISLNTPRMKMELE